MHVAERYLIEFEDDIAGIIVRDGDSYVFHASAQWAWRENGARFSTPEEAQRRLSRLREAA